MPQGSDFDQRKIQRERIERRDLEKVYAEIDELRMRVRELEEIVASLADKLDVKTSSWNFWK